MKWIQVDQWYATNSTWTMVIHGSKALGNQKFGLFENGVFRAVANTQKEAVALHKALTGKNK